MASSGHEAPLAPPDRLHLGCGLVTPTGWINVDGSWNARLSRLPWLRRAAGLVPGLPAERLDIPWSGDVHHHDVKRPLPFGDASFSAVYASHLLEHLYLQDARRLLLECHRVLVPGGTLRLVVPDLRSIVDGYVRGDSQPGGSPADLVNERLLLRGASAPAGNLAYRLYAAFMDFHSHKWMYDADSLTRHVLEAGFVDVRERAFLSSAIPGIAAIRGQHCCPWSYM